MINYKKFQSKAANGTNGKWYVRAFSNVTVDLDGLAKHMASHNLPYSRGVIHGVLMDMVACVKELVLDGKKVKLADLAIFSAGIHSKGVLEKEKCTADRCIIDVHLNARPTGELRSMLLTREAQKQQLAPYSVDDDEKE